MTNDPDDSSAGEPNVGIARTGGWLAGDRSDDKGLFDVPPVWFKIGMYLFFLLWVGYLLNESRGYTRFEDYFFPMLVGVPIVILILLQLVIVYRPDIADRVRPDDSGGDLESPQPFDDVEVTSRPKAEREKYEVLMVGWVLLLPAMSYYLGMGFTTLVYTFSLTAFLTRDVRTSLIVTTVVILFIWLLFIQTLDMIIWEGVWGITDPFRLLSDLSF